MCGMKRKTPTQIFVDDGYPEASDYDTNFIGYDPSVRGSCERALLEAQNRAKMQRAGYAEQTSRPVVKPVLRRFPRF